MPVETSVTRCGNCGATLERRDGQTAIQCGYCRQATYLAPTATATAAATLGASPAAYDDGASLHQRLLRGASGASQGNGLRYSPAQMATRDVASVERGIWPSGAQASSTFGGSWSPSALLGAPRVYPRCGDIGGAWAPGPARSPVEWIELEYTVDAPAMAVRIFETNQPGSTFAVVDVTHGEALLYEGSPRATGEAQVLEVAVDPPRPIRRLRVYMVNPGWAEVDTVGLIAAAPLPEAQRTSPAAASRMGGVISVVLGVVALVVVAIAVGAATHLASPSPGASPAAAIARPAVTVPGATIRYDRVAPEALAARGVVWAGGVAAFSSEFSSTANAAAAVRGPPDVYPQHGDLSGAWASRATDAGEEWVEVRFQAPGAAASVLWAETFNPGAVVRVDDVSDPAAPVVLWTAPPGGHLPATAIVAEVVLPAPRMIRAVRLVLDTRLVAGWNEIDAIGLVPSR